ncbi:enoyl-CoA hydratase/isomerase family protein [Breoghania sp.]|uniref:enoyl-CoA hydratase/isomerase family protein n=1 Tax=Breoghania sp. TaxID=2065378 RepID=UPI0029CA190E|nr:enoyl-CoA hydratase/isomerase family protein [Breoghania sp.]
MQVASEATEALGLEGADDLVVYRCESDCVRLTLNRPSRANALVPALLSRFRDALATAVSQSPRVLILDAAGKAFSTGTDISGHLEHADDPDRLRAYADELIGQLNGAILDLMAFPAPVVTAVRGPVTGGSIGFLLASDIVVMSEGAFAQPYCAEMGFAPIGGWTAILPKRIGEARALEIQLLNRKVEAWRAHALGLVTAVPAREEFNAELHQQVETLRAKETGALVTARALIRSEDRRLEIARGLEAERVKYVERIALPEVIERMRTFSAA